MKIEEIETFLAIVNYKGILKAAEQLYLSQSTVSNRLTELEESLKTKLIDRAPGQKELKLTLRGEEFLPLAREYLRMHESLLEWSNFAHRERLRVGSVDSLNSAIFKNIYAELALEKKLYIELSTHWTDRIFQLLESRILEIGIVPRLIPYGEFINIPLYEEEFVVVSRSDLGNKVSVRHLDPTKEISFFWSNEMLFWHNDHFNTLKRPFLQVDTLEPFFQSLSIHGTWGIIPRGIAIERQEHEKVFFSEIEEKTPTRTIYLVTLHDIFANNRVAIEYYMEYLYRFLKASPYIRPFEFLDRKETSS